MKIVVATDGSFVARHAVVAAFDLVANFCRPFELHVVSVVDYVTAPAGLGKAPVMAPDLLAIDAETALAVAQEIATERGIAIEAKILRGHVVHEVLRYAESHRASMIVVGTHGRKGIARAMLGSACEGIVRQSPIPVLTVRASI